MLIIRDGWGINPGGQKSREQNGDATPSCQHALSRPALSAIILVAKLSASGSDVGLPEGQMGNSEVGHLNLGAGSRSFSRTLRELIRRLPMVS